MAKSSRSSAKKNNNQRKAASVFAPTENARAERLSAKLLEAARQAKPETSDVNMDAQEEPDNTATGGDEMTMELDSSKPPKSRVVSKNRIAKRKSKKSGIVFTKYSDRLAAKKKKSGK